MADKKDKTYGSITKTADTKKQQGKMPPDTDFSKNIKVAQNTIRNRVEETGEKIETSDSVQNIGKSFSDAVRGMTQAVGQSAVDQRKVLAKIVSQNKTAGGSGLNPKEMAKILAAVNAKQAKQAIPKKIPGLAKGGFVSKTGLAKIHTGESVFPKGSLEELVSLMKEQVYHIKQISGFYDDVDIPDLLKKDDKTLGDMFKDWIKGGLYSAFPTFIKIGKAIGKPFYKLFKSRGGIYQYASQLSKAESPFRQISENIGVLYTGSMLRMDRMINIQKAIAEAVRDLSTHTTGKTYPAVDDIKPSKKWRMITKLAKGIGKGILGLGGAALGGMAGMAMGGPLGAIAGAAGGGMLGYKKGGTMLKGAGKVVGRSIMGKDVVTDEEFKRFAQWKKEKAESLKFWKRKKKKEEWETPLLPGLATGGFVKKTGLAKVHAGETVFPKDMAKKTMKEPLGVKFAKVKSKFSKKNKDNVIDIALNPESQKALDQIRDTSKQAADSKTKEAKGGGFFSKLLPFLPLLLGFLKPGKIISWLWGLLKGAGLKTFDWLWETAKGWGGKAWELAKGLGGKGWDLLKGAGGKAWEFAKGLGGKGWDLLKGAGGKGWGWLQEAGKGLWSKGGGLLKGLGKHSLKLLRGVPVIGQLLMAGAAGWEIGTLINDYLITPFLEASEKKQKEKTNEISKDLNQQRMKDMGSVREDFSEKGYEASRRANLGNVAGRGGAEQTRKEQDVGGLFGDNDIPAVGEAQRKFLQDNLGSYLPYHPFEIDKMRAEWLETPDAKQIKSHLISDPFMVGERREKSFLKYLQEHGTKMTSEENKAEREKFLAQQKAAKGIPSEVKPPPSATPIDATENLIKIAKESATKTLTDTYGMSASEARRYVDIAAKDFQNDVHSLTDASVLSKAAYAYSQGEPGASAGEKARPGAPSDYGKTSAINEANQAALTANAVEEGVTKGMKPAMAEQAKNLSAAITATSNSGTAVNSSSNVSNSSSNNSNSNYVYPGAKDVWSEQAQRGAIPR
jgi:hypothetical protein